MRGRRPPAQNTGQSLYPSLRLPALRTEMLAPALPATPQERAFAQPASLPCGRRYDSAEQIPRAAPAGDLPAGRQLGGRLPQKKARSGWPMAEDLCV